MNLIAHICVDRRWLGWSIVFLLSIPPVFGFLGFRVAEPLPAGWVSPEVITELRKAEEKFESTSSVVLVLESDNFFQRERIEALRTAVQRLREMEEVRYLSWLGDVQEVTLLGRRREILPKSDSDYSTSELEAAKKKLTAHPLVARNMMSADGNTILFLVDAFQRTNVPAIRRIAREVLDPAGIRTRVTGTMALYDIHDRALDEDHLRIQLMAYLLVGALQLLIFRRPIAIMVACCGPVVGVVWTIGWLQLIGQAENELAKIILPVMVIMIGFTDGVHLVVRLKQLRAGGLNVRDSVFRSVLQTGPACFLTSVTTAIGFGSLVLSNSEMIAGFGRVSAIGVVVTFLAVILVSPLLAMSWLGQKMHISTHRDPLAQLMARTTGVVEFSMRHARVLTLVGIVVTTSCLLASSRLIPDDRVSDRVPNDCEEWEAMHHCDIHVGGIRSLRLMIHWPEGETRRQIWKVIRKCESVIAEEESIGQPLSINSALAVVRAPAGRDLSVLVNRLPEKLRDQFYRPDIRTTQIVARMQDLGFARFEPVFSRLEAKVDEIRSEHSEFQIEFVSDVIVEGRVVSQMIHEMMESLAMAAVIIFFVLAVGFRSIRIGLISIIPNIMPLAVSGSIQLIFSESVGVAGACSFAICLGIAVDDTIHYLWHFQHERRGGASAELANRRSFVTVGSALLMTTVVMTAGLGTVMTSRLPPHVSFAAMACTTLAVALPADLLFLPALLKLFPGRGAADSVAPPEEAR